MEKYGVEFTQEQLHENMEKTAGVQDLLNVAQKETKKNVSEKDAD